MIHLDYETASFAEIGGKNGVGTYRYNNDKSTRILMFAVARGEDDPVLWRFDTPDTSESRKALKILHTAIAEKELIYAHNAPFEIAATKYRGRKDLGLDELPSLDQYRCTMAMCQKAAIPSSLKGAGEFLNIEAAKDDSGDELIQIFSNRVKAFTLYPPEGLKLYDKSSKGRKHPTRKSLSPIFGWDEGTAADLKEGIGEHHDEVLWDWQVKVKGELVPVRKAWDMFCNYCKQDVRAEREIHKKLKNKFELKGPSLASWQFNIRMNDRGVPVNLDALKKAQKLVRQYQRRMHTRFVNLTGFKPSQRAKVLAWLQDRGYHLDNMQGDPIEDFLSDFPDLLTDEGLKALKMYRLLNFAALAKVTAMLACACDDGYVRGTLFWHGARTGRATGKLIQPQNIKKATVDTRVAYQMICDGCTLEEIEELWDSPLEVIASCARHFIQIPGQKFNDADYVGVEARLAPWAVGDTDKLDSILAGICQYTTMAEKIYGVDYEFIASNRKKDTPLGVKTSKMRQVGKVSELACVYGVGGKGLQDGMSKPPNNIKLPQVETQRIVDVYRETHPKTQQGWKSFNSAAIKAIETGKTVTILDGKIKFGIVQTANIRFLVMVLPSGRRLYYPKAHVKEEWTAYSKEEMAANDWKAEKGGYWSKGIKFWGSRPNNAGWGWIRTWGARLFENAIQAMGADLLDEGCLAAEAAGFVIFLIVHDQALSYLHKTKGIEEFIEALCSVGDWALKPETGIPFPLAADGGQVPYYLKD